MSNLVITTSDPARTQAVGEALGGLVEPGDVLLLTGDLGAGKTQLTKGLASGLGVSESVTSPTFNILLVHEGRIPLYHFDLYRLDSADQLEDLDYFATLEADGVCVVEWGDRFEQAAPLDGIVVAISIDGDSARTIRLTPIGERGAALARAWVDACGTKGDVS